MIGKTQDTVQRIVEAWAADAEITHWQVLSTLSELMRKHGLLAFGREQAVDHVKFRQASEQIESDGSNWDSVWFHHREYINDERTCFADSVVYLKDLVIERERLRKSVIEMGKELPGFWFTDSEKAHESDAETTDEETQLRDNELARLMRKVYCARWKKTGKRPSNREVWGFLREYDDLGTVSDVDADTVVWYSPRTGKAKTATFKNFENRMTRIRKTTTKPTST